METLNLELYKIRKIYIIHKYKYNFYNYLLSHPLSRNGCVADVETGAKFQKQG